MNGISTEEQERRDREREAKAAMDSLQKSNEALLKEIFFYSQDAFSHGPKRTIAYFSSLLVNLARQADESTKKIVKLTKTLTCLTWIIAILTAILLLMEIPKKVIFKEQSTTQENKNTNIKQSNQHMEKTEFKNNQSVSDASNDDGNILIGEQGNGKK